MGQALLGCTSVPAAGRDDYFLGPLEKTQQGAAPEGGQYMFEAVISQSV